MTKIAFLFPGQGSQHVGMGRHIVEHSPDTESFFERADAILGVPMTKLCWEGPEEELKQTENTQPALFITSAATAKVLEDVGISPWGVAGHSLGEYTALYASGVFNYEAGLKLVRLRGEAMGHAGRERKGAMAAIIGLDAEQVKTICEEISNAEIVVPANINEPSQTVISGDPEAVQAACAKATEAGAKRALPLPVSGAFHSPLVAPAADTMRTALMPHQFNAPRAVFVNNVDAEVLRDPTAIKDSLVRQITGSVRWVDVIRKLIDDGAEAFIEVGSGKALAGLLRRIDRSKPVYTTDTAENLQKVIDELS